MAITEKQMDAIQQFAHRNGRNWKSVLRECWMNGDYQSEFIDSASLQQLRNEKGPTWLINFKLPKFVEVAR